MNVLYSMTVGLLWSCVYIIMGHDGAFDPLDRLISEHLCSFVCVQ